MMDSIVCGTLHTVESATMCLLLCDSGLQTSKVSQNARRRAMSRNERSVTHGKSTVGATRQILLPLSTAHSSLTFD